MNNEFVDEQIIEEPCNQLIEMNIENINKPLEKSLERFLEKN